MMEKVFNFIDIDFLMLDNGTETPGDNAKGSVIKFTMITIYVLTNKQRALLRLVIKSIRNSLEVSVKMRAASPT